MEKMSADACGGSGLRGLSPDPFLPRQPFCPLRKQEGDRGSPLPFSKVQQRKDPSPQLLSSLPPQLCGSGPGIQPGVVLGRPDQQDPAGQGGDQGRG